MSDLLSATGARLCRIERFLRSRSCVTSADMRASLRVSPATLKRDLHRLRDEMGAVIVFDAHTKSYALRNGEWPGVLPALYAEAQRV